MHPSYESPSSWLTKYAPLIQPGGSVLDLACGAGRNTCWLAQQGWHVDAVDRDAAALAGLHGLPGVNVLQADLETGAWPYAGRRFDGIVVCRYLHRPLMPLLAASLSESGVLIYETFMLGQEQFGRPSNPEFLLRPDELLQTFSNILQIVDFEQGMMPGSKPAVMQRICARR